MVGCFEICHRVLANNTPLGGLETVKHACCHLHTPQHAATAAPPCGQFQASSNARTLLHHPKGSLHTFALLAVAAYPCEDWSASRIIIDVATPVLGRGCHSRFITWGTSACTDSHICHSFELRRVQGVEAHWASEYDVEFSAGRLQHDTWIDRDHPFYDTPKGPKDGTTYASCTHAVRIPCVLHHSVNC